mmetsp:Transcript_4519/g.8345  ORF Transcript_4519/g.8345 Transcript_4519/m.8345 type:complete len:517 (-) Transcript_4519:1596-3146(-)
MSDPQPRNQCEIQVAYVRKENAKIAKTQLEKAALLDKRFRMVPATSTEDVDNIEEQKGWIAVPILHGAENQIKQEPWDVLVEGFGHQMCPYSSKMIGSRGHVVETSSGSVDLTLIQMTILGLESSSLPSTAISALPNHLVEAVRKLNVNICPRQLELFGDDRTIILPPQAFEGQEFLSILQEARQFQTCKAGNKTHAIEHGDLTSVRKDFWRRLARAHNSSRIARKGAIDPDSSIRESGHRLVWPHVGIPDSTGPGSPSWIRVTEQGIKQSFDITRVMFSRGNVSEKIRFGKLVKEGDVVLDMYAGIGYYTLPALIHGRASFVYACEWNEHAANALEFNVMDNKVGDRTKIMVGDCRKLAKQHNLVNLADRVSLGLLPSSEGGWRTAIRALKNRCGGWLHVHGNVPVKEAEGWALWVCRELSNFAREEGKGDNFIILCSHMERVKSFAPTICHYVADIFVGPPEFQSLIDNQIILESATRAGILQSDSSFLPSPADIAPPSCALSPDGVLSQEWMR